jgi:hypothetical protein
MKLRRALQHVLVVVGSAALALISAFFLAFLTAPFWGWFEARTGIESLGHSGPADWVFEVIFALCFLIFLAVLEWTFSRSQSKRLSP